MNVYFSPIVWDKKIKYIFGSESVSVTVDDITDEFYFGNLKEDDEDIFDILTATLAYPIMSVEIVNGEIYVVVLNPISDDASYEEKFPEWVKIHV